MAGRQKALSPQRSKRAMNRKKRNSKSYRAAVALANEFEVSIAPPMPIADVMELVYRRTHALWQFAASQADQLDATLPDGKPGAIWQIQFDAQGNPLRVPNKWIEYERALREELWEQSTDLTSLDIDERRVRIEEAQMEILGRALTQAAKDTGLDQATQKLLGSNLRKHLAELSPPPIEGTANPVPSPAASSKAAA